MELTSRVRDDETKSSTHSASSGQALSNQSSDGHANCRPGPARNNRETSGPPGMARPNPGYLAYFLTSKTIAKILLYLLFGNRPIHVILSAERSDKSKAPRFCFSAAPSVSSRATSGSRGARPERSRGDLLSSGKTVRSTNRPAAPAAG